jgi:transposase InsO family protein
MKEYSNKHSVVEMAKILGVTPSGYYSYCSQGISQRALNDSKLLEKIKDVFFSSRETYGRYRIYIELKRSGETCSQHRISRLMKENDLVSKARRRFKVTTRTDSTAKAAPNKLEQDFVSNIPNEKWVSDITYIWTSVGWLYLAVVMDLFSRKIIGMAMGSRITKELVCKAFLQAMLHRGYPSSLLYHSDRGKQYTSNDFQNLMKIYQMQVSMSGTGNAYDNAAMESFFHTLKLECTDNLQFETREEAMNNIFDYVEIFYNNKRIHSHLGYVSPNAFEEQFGARN